jgi:signal transduction histidine kinase
MSRSASNDGLDAWDRLTPLWHLLFVGTLLAATGLALLGGDLPPGDRVWAVALALAFALAHWLVLARNPQWWERRLLVLGGYWVVAAVLTTVLVGLSASYSLVLYGLYPLMFVTLGWWAMVPVVGLTALTGWMAGFWSNGPDSVVSVLASAGVAALVAGFVSAIARQSEQRRDALAALAATRAELAETARHAGVLAERERLARELHDTVAQGFTSVVTQLESAEQALDDRPADARVHLGKARRTARDSLDQVRRSVRALRPDLLEAASLSSALQQVTHQWSEDSGVRSELRTTGQPVPLHPEVETALLRTAQESLVNVARHARASRVIVSLSFLDDTVTLDVDDDGRGFDGRTHPHSDGGFGLIGMRERIEAAGGELTVESRRGEGTTIAASVPA